MRNRRTDPSGRNALLGCGAAFTLLAGLVGVGLLAYVGAVVAVRSSTAYRSAMSAIDAREVTAPVLGPPLRHGWWLGLQLGRSDTDALELRVRSIVSGQVRRATVYTTLSVTADDLEPTSVLLTIDGEVIDVLTDNATSAAARIDDRTTTLLDQARDLFDRARFAEALLVADQAVELDADNASARALRGHIHLALGDAASAEADAREALNLDPDHGEGMRLLAGVHHADENWPACIDVATLRLRAAPRDGAAWTVRARCYLGSGKRRAAAAGAREACDLGDEDGCTLARALE